MRVWAVSELVALRGRERGEVRARGPGVRAAREGFAVVALERDESFAQEGAGLFGEFGGGVGVVQQQAVLPQGVCFPQHVGLRFRFGELRDVRQEAGEFLVRRLATADEVAQTLPLGDELAQGLGVLGGFYEALVAGPHAGDVLQGGRESLAARAVGARRRC